MGNICRSPTAEGVFRHAVATRAPDLRIEIDSAGTHDYHIGAPPDRRSIAAASRRGIDLSSLRARMVATEDFAHYDLILAMDEENLRELKRRAPADRILVVKKRLRERLCDNGNFRRIRSVLQADVAAHQGLGGHAGWMLWFIRNMLAGSKRRLIAASRS